jgi:hypothetical protein
MNIEFSPNQVYSTSRMIGTQPPIISGVVCSIGSAEGSTCPAMALADSDNGSTIIEGISCPFTTSSSTTSPTLRFDFLGFNELALKIQEKGRN